MQITVCGLTVTSVVPVRTGEIGFCILRCPVVKRLFKRSVPLTGESPEVYASHHIVSFTDSLPEHFEVEALVFESGGYTEAIPGCAVSDNGFVAGIVEGVGSPFDFAVIVEVDVFNLACSPASSP